MKKIAVVFGLLILFLSCRKERQPAEWESGFLFPVFHTTLSPGNLAADSLLAVNNDQSVDLVYNSRVYDLQPSELLDIPDTTIENAYGLLFIPVIFSPGQVIFSQTDEMGYNLGDIGLRYARIRSGKMSFTVRSEIQERTVFNYSLPKAFKNGQPFQFVVEVPAATASQAATKTVTFDLSGYSLELSGINNNTVNTFYSSFSASVAADGQNVQVEPGDSLSMLTSFIDIIPEYARGYFGQHEIASGLQQSSLDFFNKIVAGSYGLEAVTADVIITNYIGAEATINIDKIGTSHQLSATPVDLAHAEVGQPIHINRATDLGSQWQPVSPTVYNLNLDQTNSNILTLLENMPGSISLDANGTLNPMGNVSGWNDFLYADYGLSIDLNINMPLQFSSTGLTMVDTLEADTSLNEVLRNINDGTLRLYAENDFPFSATIQITPVSADGVYFPAILATGKISAAIVNVQGKTEEPMNSILEIPLTPENISSLMHTEKFVIQVILDTQPQGNRWKIYNDYKLDLRLVADIDYQVRVK